MTRLEILLSYTPNRVRDTWISMGQQEVDDNVRVYTRNSVFRCVTAASALNGCILYCDSDITVSSDFDWVNYSIANLSTGDIQDNNFIIQPNIHIVLQQSDYQQITVDYDPTFIPFQETELDLPVIIEDTEYNKILVEAGVPFINNDELEYDQNDIMELMIKPAMFEYFKWYPIITIQRYGMTDTNFSIPIPSWAFTAQRVYINPGYPISNVQGNPLARYFDEVLMSISPRGAFSTPNINSSRRQGFVDTGSYATYILERAARQGIINYGTRTRIRIFIQQGMVKGYSTKRGVLEIEWASNSVNWDDIPFNRQSEVRELAKAYVLRAFAMLRLQAKSDVPGTINYEQFLTRADTLEEKIIKLWQESTKTVAIRV
jgi:hypothetical protein